MKGNVIMDVINSNNSTVYCHFSFRRPRNVDYGIFAVAFYLDFEGKKLTAQATKKFPLWKDHQFITAIQSYEYALSCIYEWQGIMRSKGITNVMLVTDNSTLAGWIENPKKNKKYTEYMNRAVVNYKAGAPKEIILSIGLCDVRDYEKSYKFCKEEYIKNNVKPVVKNTVGIHVIDLESSNLKYKTIEQLEKENPSKPEIIGM